MFFVNALGWCVFGFWPPPPFPPLRGVVPLAGWLVVGLTTWLVVVGIACSFGWRVIARGAEAPLTGEFSACEADHWLVYQVLVC
jgi:hypothetical protein